MDPLFALAAEWWWVAPTAVAAGAVTYGGLTSGRRRARRLELDAARHDERVARDAHVSARARVRHAEGELLAAKAVRGGSTAAARQSLAAAKQGEKQAMFALRAARSHVKAAQVHYHAASASSPLPLERLMAAHDAVLARWMEYETDPARAIAFPQMLEGTNPALVRFLHAHREAKRLRPASPRARISPAEFADYRRAVRATEVAFDEAEQAAYAAARGGLPHTSASGSGAAGAFGEAAAAFGAAAGDKLRTIRWREVLGMTDAAASGPAPAAPADGAASPAQPVWPVPARDGSRPQH